MAKPKVNKPPRSIEQLTKDASRLLALTKNEVRGAAHHINEAKVEMSRAKDHRT